MASKVLIVDDDPMLRRLLSAHLTTAGYSVIEAVGGAEGLSALRSGEARIAFVDYDMPEMNGIDVCRLVRADASIPFAHLIILTAYLDRALTIAALDSGANDFMTKPFHRGELLARLRAGERSVRLQDAAAQTARLEVEQHDMQGAITTMKQSVRAVLDHELRVPIAALHNMASLLAIPGTRRVPEWDLCLSQIDSGIQRLVGAIDELSVPAGMAEIGRVKPRHD
jgi:DNA-binding response OmpR family regulator